MAATCSVCRHPKRRAIDKALALGTPVRDIAGRYGCSKSALARHAATDLPARVTQAVEAAAVKDGLAIVAEIRAVQAKALAICATAERTGDLRTAVAALREVRACLMDIGTLTGQVKGPGSPHVTITTDSPVVIYGFDPSGFPKPRLPEGHE